MSRLLTTLIAMCLWAAGAAAVPVTFLVTPPPALPAGADTLELVVAGWAEGLPVTRPETITGHVETFAMPEFLNGRRVWVYLPPGYDLEPDRRYPVLYMFDGQNVFNEATSFVGEWQVDETLERLIAAHRVAPLIVVAVDHGGDRRGTEYTPWPTSRFGGGGGAHLQEWVDVLLPAINERFRTRTGPENTGLAGSSLGGLMSLYGGFAHADVFGRIGAFSPSLQIGGEPLYAFCAGQSDGPEALYLDMGTREEGNPSDADSNGIDDTIDALRRMTALLAGRGFVGGWDLLAVEDEGAVHNEGAWARRLPGAVEFLFPWE